MINYQDFEIFGANTQSLHALRRGKNHRFIVIRNNNTFLFVHQHDFESANKAYMRCVDTNNLAHLSPEEIQQVQNGRHLPEYRLYGYRWIANRKQDIQGCRAYVVSHIDRYDEVDRMFNREPTHLI